MLTRLGSFLASCFGDEDGSISSGKETLVEVVKDVSMLSDLLPYDSFDPETAIFYHSESLGFVIETLPLVGSSEEMQKEITHVLTMLLPEGSSLQVMLWADPHIGDRLETLVHARSEVSSMLYDLVRRRVDYLTTWAHHTPFPPSVLRTFRVLVSVTLPQSSHTGEDIAQAQRLQQQIRTTLDMLQLPVWILKPEDLLSLLQGMLHGDPTTTKQPALRWNRFERLADQVGCSEDAWTVDPHGLVARHGDHTIRTYTVRHFPSIWSLHAMGTLIGDMDRDQAQIACPFVLHYSIHVPKQDGPRTKVMAKATYVDKQAYSPIGKYLPDIQREAEELGFVREQIGKGERIVWTHFGVMLMSPTVLIDAAEQTLMNLMTAKEWKLEANHFLHLPMLISALPMMGSAPTVAALRHLKKLKTTLSTEAANLLPLQGEWQGTPTPSMVLCGRRGQILTWSPFDNQAGNYNVCVVGRSGSGKSVFMQELMTATLGLGGRVFVLDVGRSFEKTCFLLEGQFMEFTPHSPLCLNPFSNLPVDQPDVADDALAMLKSVIGLMAAPRQGMDDKGAALIEQALVEVWAKHHTSATITHIADWLLKQRDERAKDLGKMLFPYTKNGTYGRFFNGPSTVNFHSNLVVVELEELKERKDLQAVIVQMVIMQITNQMFLGDRQTPFHIVFDEAWDMLRGSQSGVFIETLARRLRKYRGSLVVGTQSLNDFFVNPGAQAAFDNSDWMCLLSQKPESIDQAKAHNRLSLSPHKEALLKSVKTRHGHYAEVMVCGPQGYAVGRLILDPFSSLLYSTQAADYTAIQALKHQGLSISEAVEALYHERTRGGER